MSNGAYIVAVPIDIISSIFGLANKTLQIAADAWQRQAELTEQSNRCQAEVARAQEAATEVLNEITNFMESMKSYNYQYHSESVLLAAREAGVSTEVAPTLNLSDLMFMEVNAQTQQITYVILDFSDSISMQSAKNSAQFKKFALASDLMKQVMFWPIENPQEQTKLNQLIELVNKMLDDNTVSFPHFQQFVRLHFSEFQQLYSIQEADIPLWEQYCALCVMCGERPKRLGREALTQETQRLLTQAATNKFLENARRAFRETATELGLEIQSDYMLDQVPGALLVDSENPGFNLFVSEHDVSFMMEMVDTGAATSETRRAQYDSMCQTRRAFEVLMLKKGYRLQLCVSDDEGCASTRDVVEAQTTKRELRAERIRKKRILEGKNAKLKMAGEW